MMQRIQHVGVIISALALGACLASPDADSSRQRAVVAQATALTGDETKPVSDYYTLRRDLRRCVSPICGGYWAALVNRASTRCADGTEAPECYVAELSLPPGTSLDGAALVHAQLELQEYPALQAAFGVMRADAVLSPVVEQTAARGQYALAYDTGIRCITTPCPSVALALLNADSAGSNVTFAFAASDPKRRAALESAFYAELGTTSAIGVGAVAFGRSRLVFDRRARAWHGQFTISNVYVTRPSESPVCLVETQDMQVTAWNFETAAAAQELANGLSARVDLLTGPCSEQMLPCTREYAPVHGSIDALGDACVDASNACAFRVATIRAAGLDSKARGTWQPGSCREPVATCEVDADCVQGFCGWDANDARLCRPWAAEGEHCEGFVLPEAQAFCAPGLSCHLLEPTGDAGGVCLLPRNTFSCGDRGLTCSYLREYCQATVGGVPHPETGEAVISYACASAGECSAEQADCACLESHGRLPGASCDDNGLLPPLVTFYAP